MDVGAIRRFTTREEATQTDLGSFHSPYNDRVVAKINDTLDRILGMIDYVDNY